MADVENAIEEIVEDTLEDMVEDAVEDITESEADTVDDIEDDIPLIIIEEAERIPETATVYVGDVSITGPPDMVERLAKPYLDSHMGSEEVIAEAVADAIEPEVTDIEEYTSDPGTEENEDSAPLDIPFEETIPTDTSPQSGHWLYRKWGKK